ncbi:MAG TPA: HmuY family protein [Kofleriaceae bacterium]|jgi:hypothetical protein|nr:HmuY family protein [Kofleriaceae bacterium]
MSDVVLAATVVGVLCALPGCAENIRPDVEPDAADGPVGKVATVRGADGIYTTRVDATAVDTWTHVDLETGAESSDQTSWDLAAQRFHLKLNGGVSGTAGVEVAPVPGALADVTAAPTTGWITDAADGEDENMDPDYAFEQGDGWYAYDPQTHLLTPHPTVWVVRTGAGAVVALQITDYYDDAGTSGHFTMTWKALDGGGS